MMTIGQKIKALRTRQNMSVDELAFKLGKNRATIYRYEKGDIENLPLDALEPLANALNTTPAYLMGWESDFNERDITAYEFLKLLRQKRNMSVEEFSKELGITSDDLYKYETGQKYMTNEVINTIFDHYEEIRSDVITEQHKINEGGALHLKRTRIWHEYFGHLTFTDEEYKKMLEYGSFLLYLRNNRRSNT